MQRSHQHSVGLPSVSNFGVMGSEAAAAPTDDCRENCTIHHWFIEDTKELFFLSLSLHVKKKISFN